MIDTPQVTVICITYNHEAFLSKALDSFVGQQTSFSFKVFVGEDSSSDGTANILREYALRHPETIVPFFRKENMGAQRNLIDMCQQAGTKYIAFCEGDDYWTDPLKLQKQYDYMESHPRISACFHDTEISIETDDGQWFLASDYSHTSDGKLRWSSGHKRFEKKPSYTIEDYIPCGFVHTSSMFFRWDYSVHIPEWYYHHIVGDYSIWLLQISEGHFGFLEDTMSVHRRQNGGSYHFENRVDFWKKTKCDWVYLDQNLRDYFSNIQARESVLAALKNRQADDLRKYLRALFLTSSRNDISIAISELSDPIAEHLDIESKHHPGIKEVRTALGLPAYLELLPKSLKRPLAKAKSLLRQLIKK